MKYIPLLLALALPLLNLGATTKAAGPPALIEGSPAEHALREYFQNQVTDLSSRCLTEIKTLADWESRRAEYRRQLQEMLGLYPWPERTDLKPEIVGKIEQADFTVEKLQFQASPGLYVTANLYLPRRMEGPTPAILYACGHSRVVTNGVSCGNKVGYQHHAIWFARNGYVCLMIDTLQLGEIQGDHRGTHTEGQWWWNSRGYTPAGVEAWFGIRALDYLCSRPEVDKERIGMTGRSGGGSYTWTVAALDERVKVAAPIAGITDLQNQVVDGAVDGHCDCMFYVNTYRWDFPQVAALLAPRPLLIGNSDKDRLFPLDGVVRLHSKVRRIYGLYGVANNLGLLITEGPHADTQDLQVPVFRWFNRFLKHESPLIEMAARKRFDPQQLRVFSELPKDQVNTTIQERFVRVAPGGSSRSECTRQQREAIIAALRKKVFAGWPGQDPKPGLEPIGREDHSGCRGEEFLLRIQPGVVLKLFVVQDAKMRKPERVILKVLDSAAYTNSPARGLWFATADVNWAELQEQMQSRKAALAFVAPRLVAPEEFLATEAKRTQVRRRFMLVGQTLDSMRVWDIRAAAQALRSLPRFKSVSLVVAASGQMGVNAAYAGLLDPTIKRLELQELPKSHRAEPDYLNVLTVTDLPQVLALLQTKLSTDP